MSQDDMIVEHKGVRPHAYQIGKVHFRNIIVSVDPRVLVPRRESGLLVDIATQLPQVCRVHEVGTGSGAVALAIKDERPDLIVTASDVSADALAVARQNARNLGLQVSMGQGSMLAVELSSGMLLRDEEIDLIVANLPYITEESARTRSVTLFEEPRVAVFDWADDGLGFISQLIRECESGQRIALEHDTHHGPAVRAMLDHAVTLRDQEGNERTTVGVVK